MIHQIDPLWPLSLLHIFSAFFPPKIGGSSAQFLCNSYQRWATLVGCFAVIFHSSSSHTSSIGFKSTDCTGQDISWRKYCSSLLLIYLWQSLLVCFRSLSCMSRNTWATRRVQEVYCDSRSDSIYLHLVQIPHTVTQPCSYFMVGVIQGTAALSPTLCCR